MLAHIIADSFQLGHDFKERGVGNVIWTYKDILPSK